LLERGARCGGALETIRRDGFVIETGADSFLSEKVAAAELARRSGLGAELIPTREIYRKTYVVRAGRLVEIPAGFSLIAPAHLGPVFRSRLFSPLGKLRLALEPFIAARTGNDDESLDSFVTRRLGREVLDRVAQALAGGIYTADPKRLSMAATMPRFVEMERRHGSVVKGMRAAENARASRSSDVSGARWSMFLSFRNGMATLPETLAARLGASIRKGAEVVAMARNGGAWRIALESGDSIDADAVICAAPAYAAARIVATVAPVAAKILGGISYASAATVNLTFREGDFDGPPRAFGFVVPSGEHRRIIAGSFSSFKFEGRAPAGAILARAFVGGEMSREMMTLSDDEMVAAVRDEFRGLLGVSAAPGFAEVRRWPDSMPQYEVGHLSRVAEIERAVAEIPAFAIAGAAYRGVGIPDCVRNGETAADAIFAKLSTAT
jgi:oxygen-dependent protoporphyrinogen oxidase